jgi:hypothetical protein
MHLLAKNPQNMFFFRKKTNAFSGKNMFFSGKNQCFFRKKPMFFGVFSFRGHCKRCYLDVLRQNQKTQKTIGLNQWFFHANPDMHIHAFFFQIQQVCGL